MTAPARQPGPRKAIVHIGMPKTGTTSIQSWLYGNQRELSRQGFFFQRLPLTRARPNEHAEVVVCQFDRAGILMPNRILRYIYQIDTIEDQRAVATEYTRIFGKAVSSADEQTVILSVEDVGGMTRTEAEVKGLEDWLGQFFDEISYVIYFRRQEDWLVSAYSQHVKTGGTQTLRKFFEKHKRRNYFRLLRPWIAVVGRDRIKVRLLEKDMLYQCDLLADFAQVVGIDPTSMKPVPRSNEALARAPAEYLRVLNSDLKKSGSKYPLNEPVYHGLIRFLNDSFSDGDKICLSQEQIEEIRTLNARSNESLRATFFPDRADLFPPRAAAPNRIPPVAAEDVARIGVAILRAKHDGKLKRRGDLRRQSDRDVRGKPRLYQRAWRRLKERHPAIAARIAPIIGREVNQ